MSYFKEHIAEEQAHSLAAYCPTGKAWSGKKVSGSRFRQLLIGMGQEFLRMEQKENELLTEADISQTIALITEWEKLLGIPDDSIAIASSIAQRRANVLFKLSVFGTSLAEDFVRIAAVLGFVVTVTPADGGADIPYTDYRKRFVIVVTFTSLSTTWPWTWPLIWGGTSVDVVKALFNRIKPAVCEIIWRTA